MAKAAVVPEPEAMNPLNMLKDAFLHQGAYAWMFYFCLAGFCAANAMAILGPTPKMNYFHGAAMMVVVCYGGSTIACIICGNPVAYVGNEALASVAVATWTAIYLLPGPILGFMKDTFPGKVLTSITYEIMRTHVMINCSAMAARTLAPILGRPPVISTLICGMLGGCGGGFMPLDKGLAPLANGLNWRICSGAIGSIFLWLTLVNTDSMEMLKGTFLADPGWARFTAIAFNVAVPLLSLFGVANPFGANPLAPAAPTSDKKKN